MENQGSTPNVCAKILHYDRNSKTLQKVLFNEREICNRKIQDNYIVSSFRDQAAWSQEFYNYHAGKATLELMDNCIGCWFIKRETFVNGKRESITLVDSNDDFTKRNIIISEVTEGPTPLYSTPAATDPSSKKLMNGDKVQLLDYAADNFENWWFRIKKSDEPTIEGWLRCESLSICLTPNPTQEIAESVVPGPTIEHP